jgi:uncharacterized protein
MQLQNRVPVPLPVEDAWKVLLDVRRIAPCMPGAELTEIVDERTFKGLVRVKVGPIALAFSGEARLEEVDDVAHAARLQAKGSDKGARGNAAAKVAFRLVPLAEGSEVLVDTDLTLTGPVAQYGRAGGLIQQIAGQITAQFAENLRTMLAAEELAPAADEAGASAPTAPSPPRPTAPVSAVRLLWAALRAWLLRLLGR